MLECQPAKLPRTRKTTTWMAKAIPLQSNTMLLTVRSLETLYQHIERRIEFHHPHRIHSPSSEMQHPRITRRLRHQILEGSRREVEKGQSAVGDVVHVPRPDLQSRSPICRVEHVRRNGRPLYIFIADEILDLAVLHYSRGFVREDGYVRHRGSGVKVCRRMIFQKHKLTMSARRFRSNNVYIRRQDRI